MVHSSRSLRIKTKKSGIGLFIRYAIRDRQLLALMLPGALFFLIYCYAPMIGIYIAFTNYTGGNLLTSKWVGLKWFIDFFTAPDFFRLIRNTVLLNVYNIFYSFIIVIFFSLMLNEVQLQFYKRFIQTISYLPYFISTVIVIGLLYNFLSPNGGVINVILNGLGHDSVNFMADMHWSRTLYVFSHLWQTLGFNSIIFLSAMTGINQELYEAASVDGANRIRKMLHITLPGIYPTIIIVLILNLGQILNVGYEKIILMYSPATYETLDVIGSYIYRKGIQSNQFSYTTAVGLVSSVISIVFLFVVNKISRRLTDISLW